MSNPVSLAFPERDGQSRDESFIFRTVIHSGAIDLYYLGSAYGDLQYGGDTSEIVMTGIMEDEFNDLVRNSSIVKG